MTKHYYKIDNSTQMDCVQVSMGVSVFHVMLSKKNEDVFIVSVCVTFCQGKKLLMARVCLL